MATPIGRKHDPNYAIASTSAGDIYLSPSLLAVVPPDRAWLGISELHFASLGDGGHDYQTDAGEMFPDEALTAYSSAVAGVLGQLGAVGPQAASNMLDSLNNFVDLNGGFDGLEGISMSAMLASARPGGDTDVMQYNQFLTSGLGMPKSGGGDCGTVPVFNPATGAFGLPGVAEVKQGWQEASHMSVGELIQKFETFAFEGLTTAGMELGLDRKEAQQAAGTIMETVSGVALGVSVGSSLLGPLGPVGAVAGGIILGLYGFFHSIFGSQGSTQQDTARDVAKGDAIVVHGDCPIVKNGDQQVVGKNGSTGPAPPGAAPGAGANPPPHSVIKPKPDKCPVDDDGMSGSFGIPGWGPSPVLLLTALPIGPGVEALTMTTALPNDLTGIQLAALPSVDEAGVLVSGGAALGVVEAEMRRLEQPARPVMTAGADPWAGLAAQLQAASPRHGRAVTPAQLMQSLREHGFTPQDSIGSVLRTLHRRYG